MANERVISGAQRDRLVLVVSQGRHTHHYAPVGIGCRLRDNDPKMRNYAGTGSRDQERVAATHRGGSTAPHKRLYYGQALNFALEVGDLGIGPIRRSKDIAICDWN